jgi:hypothetical protein
LDGVRSIGEATDDGEEGEDVGEVGLVWGEYVTLGAGGADKVVDVMI